MLTEIRQELKNLAEPEKVTAYQRFFKTGVGEYGEGDIFLGLTGPKTRSVAKKYARASDLDLQQLLQSKIHEERLCALLILIKQFQKGDEKKQKLIFDFYLQNTFNINNWDLVDLSAPNIVGSFLLDKERKILFSLAKSENLWERRIAIISTFTFIRNNQFQDSLQIAERLLSDKHDLIHKAVGWMLREVGKRNLEVEEEFLQKHYKTMPRTMLRYAIEKFPEEKRKDYLKKNT